MTSDLQGRAWAGGSNAPLAVASARRFFHSVPLLTLLAVAAALVLSDLGGPWLWTDESDTALFARSILQHGVPVAWDGRSFTDSDDGLRVVPRALGRPFVMVGTPWLPYYVAAGSFALFGESEWAARLPFALAGIATVAMLYAFALSATGCRRAAFAAALLLVASPQFLLYARESRSYALNMLFTVVLLWGFLRLRRRRYDPWLGLAAVLLFYVQILPAAVALGACGALALLQSGERWRFKALMARAPWVAALTLPWMWVSWSSMQANWTPIGSVAQFPGRLAQLGAETSVAIPLVGWVVGLPLVWRSLREGDGVLLRLCGAWIASCALLAPLALPGSLLEVVGIRYVCGLLPIAAAVTGLLVARASRGGRLAYAALLILFATTHLAGNALPWLALGQSRRVAGGTFVNVPRELTGKLLNAQWWAFARGVGVRDPGTLPALVDLLRHRAAPDDVVLTNFAWDSLYYYTNLPQAMRISPEAPVYRTARALGLPAYVFAPVGVEWVVWRGGNEALLGYPLTVLGYSLPRLRALLEARGARLEPVATLPETLWENRPELFWHRFPRVGYPFAPRSQGGRGPRYRDAQAFHVHWPSRLGALPGPDEAPEVEPVPFSIPRPGGDARERTPRTLRLTPGDVRRARSIRGGLAGQPPRASPRSAPAGAGVRPGS